MSIPPSQKTIKTPKATIPKAPPLKKPPFPKPAGAPTPRTETTAPKMMWPVSKLMDTVLGIDVHIMAPGFPIHPYFGPVYLWHTPKFPTANVFVNGLPALGSGAMGYYVHIPQGIPANPPNMPYWRRYLLNIPMGLGLMLLTTLANMTIAGIAKIMPSTQVTEDFIKEVTGVDTTNSTTTWDSIKANVGTFTNWQTWVKLLLPPLPYPGDQGSVAIGSPNVQVNGAPLTFCAPLVSTSCSDIPIVPNAGTLGFSNVMIGITLAEFLKALAVSMAQDAIQTGVGTGVGKLQNRRQGKKNCGCG
ncbi:MAG: hypothetical protein SVR94_01560 [Pseudomonadota bacterium]|nr:hypothetical protein [Pseudomonadota bacterium]